MSTKKLFVFDLNPLIFFQQKISISLILEVVKEISNYQPVLFSGSVWSELLVSVKNNINSNGQISLLAGDGSVLYNNYTKTYKFFNFLSLEQVDNLTHVAITASAGLLVNCFNTSEIIIDKKNKIFLSSYFLDLEQLEKTKNKWRMNFKLNYDYLTFNSDIFNSKISEIYIFPNFQTEFEKVLNLSNGIDLVDQSLIKKVDLSEDAYLFCSKKNSVYNGIITFSRDLQIKHDDIYYVSLGKVDRECIEKLDNVIIDDTVKIDLSSKKTANIYPENSYDELAMQLFDLASVWRNFKI